MPLNLTLLAFSAIQAVACLTRFFDFIELLHGLDQGLPILIDLGRERFHQLAERRSLVL